MSQQADGGDEAKERGLLIALKLAVYAGPIAIILYFYGLYKLVNSIGSMRQWSEEIIYERLKREDFSVYNDEYFEAIESQRETIIKLQNKIIAIQSLSLLLSVLFLLNIVSKISVVGTELKLDNMLLLLVMAITGCDAALYLNSFRFHYLDSLIVSWCRIKTKGKSPNLYSKRFRGVFNSNFLIDPLYFIDGAIPKLQEGKIRFWSAVALISSISLFLLLAPLWVIFYEIYLIYIYIAAVKHTDLSPLIYIPVVSVAFSTQLLVRILYIAVKFGVKRPVLEAPS